MTRFSLTTTIVRSLFLALFVVSTSFISNNNSFFQAEAFSMSTPQPTKTIYGVPKSGWTSPDWNWGYGSGTGHDCAAICRNKYSSKGERSKLINDLLEATPTTDLEEVKLVMALKWQRERRAGYGEVLEMMAGANRYEVVDGKTGRSPNALLLNDMRDRFDLLNPTPEEMAAMKALDDSDDEVDGAVRRCSGMVLAAMGFADGW